MTIYRRFGTTNGQYLSTFRLHIKDDDENESPHEHPYPLRGCNSDLAQYSNTPSLHHSARPDSRTRTTTRTRTKRLVRAGHFLDVFPGLKPRAESCSPFGTTNPSSDWSTNSAPHQSVVPRSGKSCQPRKTTQVSTALER